MYRKKAHPFYLTAKWRKCRDAFMKQKHWICERCGKPAEVVHHIKPLHGKDYWENPEKCFGEENLMCLCYKCHAEVHNDYQQIAEGYRVNMITGEIEVNTPPGSETGGGVNNRRQAGTKN